MSSPQPPLEEEEPDDSEDWQIFEIRALGYELFETPSKPEAPNMAGVQQIEDHPWTYVSARVGRPEVVIEGSDTDSASQLDETPSQPEDSNSDTEMHFKEFLPNPLVFKTGGDRQIEDYPRTCASASVGNQQDVILIENSDNEAFKPQGVLHIKEHQRAHVPSPARSRQDLDVVKVFTMGGESKLDETLPKAEATDTYGESQVYETLPKPETFYMDSESQTAPKSEYNKTLPKPQTFYVGRESQAAPKSKTLPKPETFYMGRELQTAPKSKTFPKPETFYMDSESQTAPKCEYNKTLPKPETFYMGSKSQAAPKSKSKTLPKPETFYMDRELQTAPKSKTLPKPETFYMGNESQAAPKSKTLPKPETFYMGRELQTAPKSKTLPKSETFYMDSESQTAPKSKTLPKSETFYMGNESQAAPKSEYNKTLPKPETFYMGRELQTAPKSKSKTLPKPETFYMGNESQAAPKSEYKTLPKSEDPEAEGLHEDLIEIMREFNLDVYRTTQCLFFNSGEVGSTKHFLRTGLRPDGYPIWEPMDDEDLKKNKPKLRARLVKKYGEENVAKRLAFLEC
ncbi:uncharacterized protein LOC120944797 [Rana temporaria]|uniref:uncharacterized protein LOC120944797 n=1 Tax=Rana temporaria TaxID=8407 RepID=UPI001AAE0E6A|nr:uncharacterized protein LOC120944797 [Rana temporaria]